MNSMILYCELLCFWDCVRDVWSLNPCKPYGIVLTPVGKRLFEISYSLSIVVVIIVRIHKNKQLLDRPFTRPLLEALCIKTSNYLQVKGIDL